MITEKTFIRKHYVITLPLHIRKFFPVEVGDPVEISINELGEVVIRPLKVIDATQAWFWTKKHLSAEAQAEAELKSNKAKKAKNARELIRELNK